MCVREKEDLLSTTNKIHGYGTTQASYGTTLVGYKGGSRYVEGRWGLPYFGMQKVSWFLGFLCFMDLRISKIYQDSTIAKFRVF